MKAPYTGYLFLRFVDSTKLVPFAYVAFTKEEMKIIFDDLQQGEMSNEVFKVLKTRHARVIHMAITEGDETTLSGGIMFKNPQTCYNDKDADGIEFYNPKKDPEYEEKLRRNTEANRQRSEIQLPTIAKLK